MVVLHTCFILIQYTALQHRYTISVQQIYVNEQRTTSLSAICVYFLTLCLYAVLPSPWQRFHRQPAGTPRSCSCGRARHAQTDVRFAQLQLVSRGSDHQTHGLHSTHNSIQVHDLLYIIQVCRRLHYSTCICIK